MHRDDPHFLGIEAVRLGALCAPALTEPVLTALLRAFARDKRIELNGSLVSLPARREAVISADEAMWQKVKPVFDAAGFKLPKVEDVAQAANLKTAVVEDLLYRKLRSDEVYLVAPGRFCPRTTLARLAALAKEVAQEEPEHEFTAARFRDRSGVNRLQAIEILECLDRLGITLRRGNTRIIRKDFAAIPESAAAGKPGEAHV
jgi:selenocysteine-specific elongation factor